MQQNLVIITLITRENFPFLLKLKFGLNRILIESLTLIYYIPGPSKLRTIIVNVFSLNLQQYLQFNQK